MSDETPHETTLPPPAVVAAAPPTDANDNNNTGSNTTEDNAAAAAGATTTNNNSNTPAQAPLLSQTSWTLLERIVDTEWKAKFLLLAQCTGAAGHVRVTDNPALASWLQQQQQSLFAQLTAYFGGSTSGTEETIQTVWDKMQLLRNVGVVFNTTTTSTKSSSKAAHKTASRSAAAPGKRQAVWEANFQALRAYRDRYGHCDPHNNENLKRWADRQRKRLKGKDAAAAPLSADEKQRLLDLGIAIYTNRKNGKPPDAAAAAAAAAAATETESTTTSLTIPPPAPKNLKEPARFDEMYEKMRKYYLEHGHTVVSDKKDPKLRAFLVEVRNEYKRYKANGNSSPYLTPVRMERLRQINFSFEARPRHTFEERIQQWVTYRAQHGKNPPATTSLGKWVTKQRLRYHDTKDQKQISYTTTDQHYLTDEQIGKLEAVGFDFGERDYTRVVKSWDERFNELLAFRNGAFCLLYLATKD